MPIQTFPNTGPNNVPIIPLPAAANVPVRAPETAIIHSPGEHYRTVLFYPNTPSFETTEDYQAVRVNGRKPVMGMTDVEKQLPGRGEMLGDLMLVIREPYPNFRDMQKQATPEMSDWDIYNNDGTLRQRGAAASTTYVFERQGINGPEYTIMGNAALARIAEGRQNPEGAIIHMSFGSQPVEVGNQDGNWLPSVGYDRAQLHNDPELTRIHRSVSRRQARYAFDEQGNFYYQEANMRKNPATVEAHKTKDEQALDEARFYRTNQKNKELWEERDKQDRQRPLVKGQLVHQPLPTDDRITSEDLLVRKMRTHTYGGRVVGEKHKGQHRRASFLGKIASKIFG